MRRKWVLLTFLPIGMIIFFSPSAEAYCNITNSSGSFTLFDDTYVNTNSALVANETCSISDSGASGVIIINASDITLDCKGTNLDGTNTGRGIFQNSTSNVTIKNCNITDYDYGIYLKSSFNNTLSNNTANSNDFYGFFIYSSSNNTISNNTLNSNDYGIRIYLSSNNNILANNIANWNDYGFMLYSSSNNNLTNNTANWNDKRGFCIRESSNNTQLTNNTANSNAEYGFYLDSSSNNSLTNNTMTNSPYNFLVYGTQDSHYNNSIDTSNTVNAKPIYYKVGVHDQVYDSSTNAGFVACVFCNNVTVKDLILTNNSHGILFWKTNNSIVQNITANTNYYGIRIDSSSHNNITGNNADSNDFGIRLVSSSDNNTLSNNMANSNSGFFGYGFYIQSSSNNNTLINNTADSNADHGFYIDSSDNNHLANNTALSNADCGFYLESSFYNNLTDNTADSNADYGFYIDSSTNNTLKNNNITISGTQYGIYFDAYSDLGNDIDRTNKVNGKEVLVIANDNTSATISDFDSLFSSQIRVTNYGIINLYKCYNKIIRNATVGNSTKYGIYLYDSGNNTLTNNTAISNAGYGFYLDSSSNNNLTNNTAISNAGYGFYLEGSDNNQLTSNTAYLNNFGFYVYFSYYNILTNNTAISNAGYGIYVVFLSEFNNLTHNKICYNGQGLYNDTSTNIVDNNTFCVDPISPVNNTWFSSVSTFTFNVSNPILTTSCQLYIDDTYSALNSSVSNNALSTISSIPSQGSHTWYVYCNDSVPGNWGNSSLWHFGIKQSGGSSCSAGKQCIGGYCVHGYCRSAATYCGDDYCDSGESCSSCSSDCGSCSSGWSGNGEAPAPELPSKTQFWLMITPGAAHIMKVENPDIGLKQIEIIVESRANSVSIKVEKLESKPAEIVHEVVGKAYRYFKITHNNIQDKLEKATIEFQVNKSWIDSNNIDPDTVALKRYANAAEWKNLPAERMSEDESYIYYKAETTAFSVFAISGEMKVGRTACPYDCCFNETNYTNKPCPEGFECKKNECFAFPEPRCPACPEPTNWTECVNDRQWRTSHRCGPETNYDCQQLTEERGCEMPTALTILIWMVVIAVIAALFVFLIWKGIIKLPERKP